MIFRKQDFFAAIHKHISSEVHQSVKEAYNLSYCQIVNYIIFLIIFAPVSKKAIVGRIRQSLKF